MQKLGALCSVVAICFAGLACESNSGCPEGYRCIPIDAFDGRTGSSPDGADSRIRDDLSQRDGSGDGSGADTGDPAPADTGYGPDGSADAADGTSCPPLPELPGQNVVRLGNKGLSNGDKIVPKLNKWFKSGNEVHIPSGTYDWTQQLNVSGISDASIVGEGTVVLKRPDGATHGLNIGAGGGEVEIRNLALKGVTEHRTFRAWAGAKNATLTLRNIRIPDGGRETANHSPVGMFVPTSHAGEIYIIDCLVRGFPNNGLYASAPGVANKGQNGAVHVVRGLFEDNAIAGVRIGSDNSSVRGTVVIQDDSSGANHRGVWLRETAQNMRVENVHIVQSLGAVPFLATPRDKGGSATVQDLYIRNETGDEAMQIKRGINLSGQNIHITGSGSHKIVDTTNASLNGLCRGSSCKSPRTSPLSRCPGSQ